MEKKSKYLKRALKFLAVLAVGQLIMQPMQVHAEPAMPPSGNRQFNYPNRRPNINGDFYWLSSRAREHLHSREENPTYTNKGSVARPTRGFLSGFSQNEIDQIAVTRRKTAIHGSYHSTGRNGPTQSGSRNHSGNDSLNSLAPQFIHYHTNPLYYYDSIRHVKSNDKVFILNPAEIQMYVQQRGVDHRRNVDGRGYWISGTQTYTGNVPRGQYVSRNGAFLQNGGAGTSTRGIVPALHLKPSAPTAQGLKIGDIVTFGRYQSSNGEHSGSIQWEVINITDGHPLLWATRPIDYYPYNVNPQSNDNNTAYVFSEKVRYDDYDIDITSDLKYYNPNGTHKDAPKIWLENTEDLQTRRIGSWEAVMRASSDVGIEWMEAPDGSRVYGDRITYTVTQNDLGGRYPFRAKDNHGNYHGTHLPVGNIDEDVEVDILFSMPPTGWTNQPITTTIQLSNQAVNGRNLSGRSSGGWTPFYPPTFTTYVNTRYHFKGQVRIATLNDAEKIRNGTYQTATFTQNLSSPGWLHGEYMPTNNYSRHVVFSVDDLLNAGVGEWVDIEYVREISGNFLRFSGGIGISRSYNAQTLGITAPVLEYRNVDITLLDDDNFGLNRIVLPDGQTIFDPPEVFEHTIYEPGSYTYRVLDNRGYWWEESIAFQIDNEMPEIEITNIQ